MLTPLTAREESESLPIWGEGESGELVCRAVWDETADVKTFLFTPAPPRLFRFHAGQFMTFHWPLPGGMVSRCYTIATPPTRPYAIGITVKRKPGGVVSPWLHEALRPGMRVTAEGPSGIFSAELHGAEKYLFLAGGSGITPLASMLRAFADRGESPDLVFLNAARSPADLIFRDELALLARRLASLRLLHLVESRAGEPQWPGLTGRLSPELLALIPDLAEREIFCCGPAPFMATARAALETLGVGLSRYHEESFDFETEGGMATEGAAAKAPTAEAPSTAPQAEVPLFTITLAKSGRSFPCRADQTVLAAARAAGIRLPHACTQGLCGSCKSRILSGEIERNQKGGIREREMAQGLALLCCNRPLSDLVIDR